MTVKQGGRLLALFAAVALLTSACFGPAGPTGWTAALPNQAVVYTAFSGGRVAAADATDGGQKWSYPQDDKNLGLTYYPPAEQGGNLFVWNANENPNRLVALRSTDGTRVWETPTTNNSPLKGAPLATTSAVYFGLADGTLQAVDPSSGSAKSGFSFKAGDAIWGQPVLHNETLYVTSMDHKVYAIDPNSGSVRWTFTSNGAIPGSVSFGRYLYLSSLDNTVYALDASNGQVVWTAKTNGWVWGQPLVDGDTVYVGAFDKNVYALDAATGAERWKLAVGGRVRPSPVLAADLVIAGADDGKIYAITKSGQQQWTFNAGGPVVSPLAADRDSVYASDNSSHRIIALDARSGAQRWELPAKK